MKYPGALLFAFFILNFPFSISPAPAIARDDRACGHARRKARNERSLRRIGEKPSHMFGLKAAVWFNTDENDTNLEDGWH